MKDVSVTVVGSLAADPVRDVRRGTAVTSFRVAQTPRRYDREQKTWVDGETSWYRVAVFGALGNHVALSLTKGQQVIVHGRLQISEWRPADGVTRRQAEITADAVGHDLTFGTSAFSRATRDDRGGRAADVARPRRGELVRIDDELPDDELPDDELPDDELPDLLERALRDDDDGAPEDDLAPEPDLAFLR